MSSDLTSREGEGVKTPCDSHRGEPISPEVAVGSSLLIRALPVGLVVLMLVGVTRQALKPLTDPDIWWHLRMGDELRDGWNFAQTQGWTPFATAPWVRTEWLPEVVQSWMNSAFGLPGVAWLFGVSLMVIVAVLYLVCRRQAGTLAAAVATAVGLIGCRRRCRPAHISCPSSSFWCAWMRGCTLPRTSDRDGGSSPSRGSGHAATACGSSALWSG